MVWEIIFMLVILKIPIVYLCVVVWWAIRAEPRPSEPVAVVRVEDTPPFPRGPRRSASGRPRRPTPSGPSRRSGRVPRVGAKIEVRS